MPSTYEPIATTTLGSAGQTISFTGIGSGYTDLIVRMTWNNASGVANTTPAIRFNSDTSNIYSVSALIGSGTAASSFRYSPLNYWSFQAASNTSTTATNMYQWHIFSYADSNFKSGLGNWSGDRNGSGYVETDVFLYRSTTAITRIDIIDIFGANWAAGATATLYGIKAA